MCPCFFQAGDGIRGYKVTGVQTCALPILIVACRLDLNQRARLSTWSILMRGEVAPSAPTWNREIGRASCRERVEGSRRAGRLSEQMHSVQSAAERGATTDTDHAMRRAERN